MVSLLFTTTVHEILLICPSERNQHVKSKFQKCQHGAVVMSFSLSFVTNEIHDQYKVNNID